MNKVHKKTSVHYTIFFYLEVVVWLFPNLQPEKLTFCISHYVKLSSTGRFTKSTSWFQGFIACSRQLHSRMFSISQSCKIVERHPYPKCWKGMFVLRYLLKVDPQIRCLWIVALSVRGLFPPSGSNLLSYEAKRKCNHIIGLILGMFSFFEFLWLLIPASSLKVRYFSFKGER